MGTECLWNYYRQGVNNGANENDDVYMINNKKTATNLFEYKRKLMESAPADTNRSDAQAVVPLKYLIIFRNVFCSLIRKLYQ